MIRKNYVIFIPNFLTDKNVKRMIILRYLARVVVFLFMQEADYIAPVWPERSVEQQKQMSEFGQFI